MRALHKKLRVVLIKPSLGSWSVTATAICPTQRFRISLVMMLEVVDGYGIEIHLINENVENDHKYLRLLECDPSCATLLEWLACNVVGFTERLIWRPMLVSMVLNTKIYGYELASLAE